MRQLTSWPILALIFFIPPVITFAQSNSDTLDANFKYRKALRWGVPSLLIVGGALISMDKDADAFINNHGIWEERNEHFVKFSDHLDNYLQYAPAVAAFTMTLTGVKGKNDLANQTALFIKSELLMLAIVYPLKSLNSETRPDTGKRNSFPSGHTAQAFTAATFFSKEYGHRSIWYSVGAYTVATTVGVFRVLNNRHWLSDILAGAGIGILSTNIVYATHQHRWGKAKKTQLTFSPTYQQGSFGGYVQAKF